MKAPLARALIVSLLAHLALLAVLPAEVPVRPGSQPAETSLAVRLQQRSLANPVPPPPAPSRPSPPERVVDQSTGQPESATPTEPARATTTAADWHAAVNAVVTQSHTDDRPGFTTPELSSGALRSLPAPAISAAFRPPPPKICGREIVLVIAGRRMTMPGTYACTAEEKARQIRGQPDR